MAHFITTNGFVSISSVDLSSNAKQVSLDYKCDAVDDTCMGDTSRVRLGGLKDWSITIDFAQDYAASMVDATLQPLVGTTFTVTVRPDAGSLAADNPNFTGTGILESYQPMKGNVGDLATTTVVIQAAGTLSRNVP